MTTFQILILCFSGLTLAGGIVAAYQKNAIEIAKINVNISNFRRELDAEKIGILNNEKMNREDHKELIKKFDELIKEINYAKK